MTEIVTSAVPLRPVRHSHGAFFPGSFGLSLSSTRRRFARLLAIVIAILISTSTAWSAIAVDANVSKDNASASTTVSTAAFSTTSGNELLLAFVATDFLGGSNTTVTQVTGGGLTWALVRRTNAQSGTSEIWRAFATSPLTNATVTATLSQSVTSSLTVMSFSGVDTTGTNGSGAIGATASGSSSRGAPTASLVTTRNGSWVFGVGNDYDRAVARTVGTGQSMVHQYLAPVGDTYWVQRQNATTPLSGTTVTINDTAPTADRYNLTIAEVLPAASGGGTTFSISGTITPAASGNGASVVLSQSGTTLATTPADSSGNFTFANLANGTYTITPSKASFTFSPASQNATVNGANVIGITFTATAQTWAISGTISAGSASTTVPPHNHVVVVALENHAYSSTYDATAMPWLTNLANTYGLATQYYANYHPSIDNYFELAAGTNPAANDDNWCNVTTSASCNYSGDNLVRRLVAAGKSWKVYAESLPSTGYLGGDSGAYVKHHNPFAYFSDMLNGNTAQGLVNFTQFSTDLTGVALPNFSFVVPNNADNGHDGTLQTADAWLTTNLQPLLNSCYFTGNGCTADGLLVVWMDESIDTDTANGGGHVEVVVVAPDAIRGLQSTTQYQHQHLLRTILENFGISIYPNDAASASPTMAEFFGAGNPTGVTVNLTGTSTGSKTTDVSGAYTFSGLVNGSYTVTPSRAGTTFNPTSTSVSVNGADVTGKNFTIVAAPQNFSISGTITPATAGVAVALSGSATSSTTTNASGAYTFTGLSNGSYTITPSQAGWTFTPPSLSVTVLGSNVTGQNFTANIPTYSVSGSVSPAQAGTTMSLSGTATASTTTDATGAYSFSSLQNGGYTITPSAAGLSFTPPSTNVTMNGANITGVNFTSQTATNQPLAIDVKTFGDRGTSSTTVASSAFSTKSQNELLLAFVASDASNPGITVTQVAGGGLTWTLVRRTNTQLGTSEIWRTFAAQPLTNVTVTATLSQSVQSSISIVSFTGVDTSGTNGSGAIGATASANASAGAPSATLTTTRAGSWVLGVGNDYDRAIARTVGSNQTMVHQYLSPAGDTYWTQMQTAATPNAGTTVTINDTAPTTDRYNLTIVEVLPPGTSVSATPPTIALTAPVQNATVSYRATVMANAADAIGVSGVQFLLDGNNLGAEVTSPPYSVTWDLTGVTGTHTLSAIARNAANLSTTAAPITVNVDNSGNPALVGSWAAPIKTPAVAVNLILLPNGKLLFYADGGTPYVWDLGANTFTNIVTNEDIFCSGHAALADGRILIVGGYGGSGSNIGIANAEIFDPQQNTFTPVPNMSYKRWYPTATTLADGRILVTAGWQTTEHSNAGIPEIYNPATNSWTKLTSANNPFETYPFIHLLPDGRLVHVNGSEYATVTDILDLTTNTWSVVDNNITDGGSSVMYLPNKIMKAGSAADSQFSGASANTTFTLDMSLASPNWKQTPSMAYPRSFLNLVELPDGNVLVVGGETDKNGGNIANAVYAAEMWNSQNQTWTTMASMKTPREYHATALLIPDGRVAVSGMGADFGQVADQLSAEIYSPPYLFKGARPTITQAPSQVTLGTDFSITTPDAASINSAVLIRLGMVTHFFDQNTRFVPLNFTQTPGGLTLTVPNNGNLLPPGYYMLFIVNSNGVPSVAPIVKVGP